MLVLGHRGCGVTMKGNRDKPQPENTLAAFAYALKNGADGVELDVIVTADGDLAICHDEPLNLHVVGADSQKRDLGFVRDKAMDELRKLDVGDGQGIPSLDDLFKLIEDNQPKSLNIELKGADSYRLTHQKVRSFCMRSAYPYAQVVYSSFDHEQLKKLRALDAEAKIGLLFEVGALGPLPVYPEGGPETFSVVYSWPYVESVMSTIRPTSLHPLVEDCVGHMEECATLHKLEIFAWTMNEKPPGPDSDALAFAERHAHSHHIHLITDFPLEMAKALKN